MVDPVVQRSPSSGPAARGWAPLRIRRTVALGLLTVPGLGRPPAVEAPKAQSKPEPGRYFELSLEELMKIRVASKKEEDLGEAPGVIDLITGDEIRLSGAQNLREVLARLTSFQEVNNAFIPNTTSTIRGQFLSKDDNHILFLINGRPIRESNTGGNNRALYASFPLSSIAKLEIIRGPGSVLYGSNAFAGVVNIVTRSAADMADRAALTYGSFDTKGAEMSGSLTNETFSLTAAAKLTQATGWNWRQTFANTAPQVTEWNTGEASQTLWVQATYLAFTAALSTSYLDQNGNNFFEPDTPVMADRTRHTTTDLGYAYTLDRGWTLKANLTSNFLNEHVNTHNQASDHLLEVALQGDLSERVGFIAGGVVERHAGTFSEVDYSRKQQSQYLNLDYRPSPWLKLIGGVQRNAPEETGARWSPRASLIATFPRGNGLKVQYAEAYRAPNAAQYFVNNAFASGNLDVRPETITTREVSLFHTGPGLYLAATYYRSRIEDIITLAPNPAPTSFLIWTNEGRIDFEGLELEGRGRLGPDWTLRGSVAHQRSRDQDGVRDSTFAPNLLAKFGFSYAPEGRGWSVSLFEAYHSKPTHQTRDLNPSALDVNPRVSAYQHLSGNLSLHLPTLFGRRWPNATFSLAGANLLNERISFQDFNGRQTNSVPQEGGRRLFATLGLKF